MMISSGYANKTYTSVSLVEESFLAEKKQFIDYVHTNKSNEEVRQKAFQISYEARSILFDLFDAVSLATDRLEGNKGRTNLVFLRNITSTNSAKRKEAADKLWSNFYEAVSKREKLVSSDDAINRLKKEKKLKEIDEIIHSVIVANEKKQLAISNLEKKMAEIRTTSLSMRQDSNVTPRVVLRPTTRSDSPERWRTSLREGKKTPPGSHFHDLFR